MLHKVFQTLNRFRVRYLVVGGVASVLYGNPRFTKDLDLWVDDKKKNLEKLVKAFQKLKFIPRIPVKAEKVIIKENRDQWFNPKNPFENVDLLFKGPVSFQRAFTKKKIFKSQNIRIPVISAKDLISMKKKKNSFIVTEEAIRDFALLNISKRLQWLDETRAFLARAMPARTKKNYESLRKRRAA